MTETHEVPRPIQDEISELVLLDDAAYEAQRDAFIARRVATLEAQAEAPAGPIDSLSDDYSGFLPPETEVRVTPRRPGFHLNDPKMYGPVLDAMRVYLPHALETAPNEPAAYFRAALRATQWAQESYFGNGSSGTAGEEAHDRLVHGREPGMPAHSVADFKNIALCVQRSAVANNMLQLLGVPTTLKYGEIDDGTGRVAHTFLVVGTPKGNARLYDPTNPKLTYDENGLQDSRPMTVPVPKEPAGAQVSAAHAYKLINDRGEQRVAEVPVTYYLENDKDSIRWIMDMLGSAAVDRSVEQ